MQYKTYYVYILTNQTNTTIYTGVTSDLAKRIYKHRSHQDAKSFTAKYNVTKLVYYECGNDVTGAIAREKQIKSWSRRKKNELVQTMNPTWRDLYDELFE